MASGLIFEGSFSWLCDAEQAWGILGRDGGRDQIGASVTDWTHVAAALEDHSHLRLDRVVVTPAEFGFVIWSPQEPTHYRIGKLQARALAATIRAAFFREHP